MFLKPSFFEMIQKIVANVICISQGVIIFCAPNKMDTEKKKKGVMLIQAALFLALR